jgi:hypothetical protein
MCYSAKDSINAYIIGSISSLILFSYKDTDMKILGLFFLFVSQMQLFDYIFWKNTECNNINKITTKFAIIFNHLQPVVLFLLLKFYNYKVSQLSEIIFYIYLIVFTIYTIYVFPSNNCIYTDKVCCSLPREKINNNTVINWQWNDMKYINYIYILFLLSFTLSVLNLTKYKYELVFINFFTFLISHKIPNLNRSVGRIWCYIASFMPILLILYNYILSNSF